MQVGKNGKKIPLDPATELPHDCPMRDKPTTVQKEEKQSFDEVAEQIRNDHGNETVYDSPPKPTPKQEYLDHTAGIKGQSKVMIFSSDDADDLRQQYNTFLATNNGKIKTQGAQFQMNDDLIFAIALYYEELK